MVYEIDQSGKVEDTNRATVVALANGEEKSIKISAVEKQKVIQAIRIAGRPKDTYAYKIFGAFIFLLLINLRGIEEVTIDREYPGNEPTIKNIIMQLFQKAEKKPPEIHFGIIGKKSSAHRAAIRVFRKEKKADIIVKANDVLELFYSKQNSRRSHSG
jgi:hypothetical protein